MHTTGLAERRLSSLRSARILAVLIFALGAAASLGGLLLESPGGYALGPAGAASVTNLFGEAVSLDGHGLYRRDSVSFAAQERAQDLVTLAFGLPLLAAGFFLAGRGSHGGRLVLAGALGYFLYCYGMMSVGTAYNEFFLAYVALFAASLYAFALSVYAIDADALAASCEAAYPRRSAAAFCIAVGLFLGLNWLGRLILPSLAQGRAPAGIDGASTMFVQAFDLGILVPAAFLSAFWLLRRDRRGYLVGSVLLVKGAAEGLAVAAMGFNMLRLGVAESLPMVLGFLALALCALVIGALAVASAGVRPGARQAAPR
jgi:hypothetical protein